MNFVSLLIFTTLSTACGQAADSAKKMDTDTAVKTTAPAPESNKPTTTDKEEAKPTVAEKPEKAPEITKDQMMRASIRLGFDHFLATDKLFHDEAFKTYFYKGDEGTMGYPDSTAVPVTTKNITVGCPMGFKQVGQIDLSVAISHGLLNKLPADSQWIWTSWKGTADINAYSAYAVDELTDQWGYHFDAGFFYPRHRNRVIGRLYCMMGESDLPSVDDLPAGYFDSLNEH